MNLNVTLLAVATLLLVHVVEDVLERLADLEAAAARPAELPAEVTP